MGCRRRVKTFEMKQPARGFDQKIAVGLLALGKEPGDAPRVNGSYLPTAVSASDVVPKADRCLWGFVEFERQSIWVAEKGEPSVRIWVDPDWLNGDAGGFKAHDHGIKIRHGKCQMSQACRLWMGRPHHWCWEGE